MKKLSLLLCASLFGAMAAVSAAPSDVVPDGSGLYDAAALLAQDHLLPAGAPDATDFLGVAHRLRTRAEFAALIRGVTTEPTDSRARAALAFARSTLAPELGKRSGAGVGPATFGPTGFVQPTEQGRNDDHGGLDSRGYLLGRGRILGTLGRDGTYTVSATNLYRLTRDHASFTTHGGGHEGGDSPDILNGVDEAYATVMGIRGLRVSAGLMRQRWGGGYRGDLLVSDNAGARPTLQADLPFSLGHTLGTYRFTQYQAVFRNEGRTIHQGARRLEHPIGDRVTLSLEEAYDSDGFKPISLVLPFYRYQRIAYTPNQEPPHFNYLASGELSVQAARDTRLYGQFLLDDLEAPSGTGLGNHVPRKTGYLFGYAQTFARSGTDAVLEYAHADRATYSDGFADLAWFEDGLPEGHPAGPNGNEFFARLGQKISPHLTSFVSFRDRRRVANDFPAPAVRSLDLGLDYHLGPTRSLGLQYSYYREDPFTGTVPTPSSGPQELPGQFGGADAGQRLRRQIVGLSFIQSF